MSNRCIPRPDPSDGLRLVTPFPGGCRGATWSINGEASAMIPADENFENTWPFAPHFTEAAGFRQHFVDEGSGRKVLLLHGQPTWGYIY
jgi:hypothetical protein